MNVLGSVSRFEPRTTAGRLPLAPSFFQTFPKICGSNAKFFQGFLWRFCVISETYNRSKSRLMVSKFSVSIASSKSQPRDQIRPGSLKGHANTVAQIVLFRKEIVAVSAQAEHAQSATAFTTASVPFDPRLSRRRQYVNSAMAM
jgi:hypothetical protein